MSVHPHCPTCSCKPPQLRPATSAAERVGRTIRMLRKSAGMTQADVAREIGLSRTSVVNIEAGRQRPTIDTLDAIGVALRVTTGSLVDGDGS